MKNSNYLIYVFLMLFFATSCENTETISNQENSTDFSSMQDGLITLKSGAVVEKKGDIFYFQSDMILSKEQLEALDEHGDFITEKPSEADANNETNNVHPVYNIPVKAGDDGTAVPRAFGLYPTPYNMWAMVRFVYAPDLTYDRKTIIQQALQHWEANTNVRFYNATGQPTVDPTYGFAYPYVEFVNSTVNRSSVGRIGGRQILELAAYQSVDKAIHEIGHAIGLRHEQSRYDRDNSININWSNIRSGKQHNFNKYTTNYFAVGSFDYNSIMIYPSYIPDPNFVYNTAIPVMTKKSDNSTWTGGNVLSNSDRSWANYIYLPYVARSDTYRELASIVYKSDNTVMTASERLSLQAQLNYGNPNPPNCCRLPNTF